MKIIPLLLAALGVVSATAYAAPELRVTSIGQEVEVEHTNGSDLTTAWLYNNIGLAYGDWTFGLQAAKQWNYDNEDNLVDGKPNPKGVTSNNNRVQFDSWKKINDNLKLGFRYRGQKNMDRFQVNMTSTTECYGQLGIIDINLTMVEMMMTTLKWNGSQSELNLVQLQLNTYVATLFS